MGTTQDLHRWQRVLLAVVVLVLAVTAVITFRLVRELRAANQSVSYDHAERVIAAAELEVAVFERSASTRGFLLSGDALFLENRRRARTSLGAQLDRLRELAASIPAAILDLVARLDTTSDQAIAAYTTSPDAARARWESTTRPVAEQLAREVGVLVSVERSAFAAARDRAGDAWQRSMTLLAALLGGVAIVLVLLFYGYTRITRTLLARERAEREQATFRILEQMPVGIFVLTREGRPYYANQHAKKLLGHDVASARPDQLAETYSAYEAGTERPYPAERQPIVRALAGESSECTDMEIRRGDEIVPLHVVGAPVHDNRGELLYAVAGFQDVRELQRVAMRDALTGLANRAAITQIFARERAVSARAGRSLAIALIDLDRFKSINDTHGHASGDDVLKRTAASIVASLRRSDAVARWGGEEIVLLLPNTDAAGAARAVEKALEDVRALRFTGKDGAAFSVTFSAGVVLAGASESLDEAVARADTLLYAAKAAGRDRVLAG